MAFKHLFSPIRILIGLTITLVILVIVFIIWPHAEMKVQQKSTFKSYSRPYQKLESFTVESPAPGTTISFDKPIEFKSAASTAKVPVADLHDSSGKYKQIIADIIVNILPPNPKANDLDSLKQFASMRLINLEANFGAEKQLHTVNIKNQAIQVDFTTKSKPGPGNVVFPTKKGTAILIKGKNANYYFLVDALDDNWQLNQSVWQKIINSIKVDQ